MKNLLFITTVYRTGERIFPIIPKLNDFFNIDLLLLNEMSEDLSWYGTDDPRDDFHKIYDCHFDNIYDGGRSSIEQYGARNENPCSVIKNLDVGKYDIIIYDDDRDRFGIWYIYNQVKNDIPVIGNIHGTKTHQSSLKFYDKVFNNLVVFGNKEKKSYSNNEYIISGGIPSNDELKYYDRTNDFIFVIVNFLGNRANKLPASYRVLFDENFMKQSKILELQNKYNKKVVFKLKGRADNPNPQNDFDYLNSIVPEGLDYEIIMDFPDNNQLICGSFLVISAPSTYAFKSIQKGIPTILINGAGILGNFYDFGGLVELEKDNIIEKVEEQISFGRNNEFIQNTIEGGINFNSANVYVNNIRKLLV